jgi:spoIIIJ-associated protein
MYDKTSDMNEFLGETVADATKAAARFYGVEVDELKVAAPDPNEISGSAGRVVVVAFPKNMKRPSPGGDDREGRGRGRDRDRDRGDRKRGPRRGSDDGSRSRERDDGPRSRERDAAPSSRAREDEPAAPAEPKESKGTASGDLGPVGDFILGTVERMGLGGFQISESEENELLIYQLEGEGAEGLRSGDGRAVDALQLIVSQAAKSLLDEPKRVVVDVAGEAEDREESLSRSAERAAGRALDTGRSIALDPMNGRDRRIIHIALRDTEEIATMSIGEGRYRQVVVVPEGAAEYEEARSSQLQEG